MDKERESQIDEIIAEISKFREDMNSLEVTAQPVAKEFIETPKSQENSFIFEVFEWAESFAKAFAIMPILIIFLFRVVTVSGASMNPTLAHGDMLIITNFMYTPKFGDVVVVQADKFMNHQTNTMGEPVIKRVIGVAGDTIEIDFELGEVFVNGEKLNEPYIAEPTYNSIDITKPIVVPENTIFVMGDNRNASSDSRDNRLGCVDVDNVLGKAQFRLAPFKKIGLIE